MISSARMTAEEFAKVCEQLGPCELVRGEVVTLSPGGMDHSGISGAVAARLGAWTLQTGLGRVFANEAGLFFEQDPDTVRGADVAYFSFKRLPKGKRPSGFSRIPPELAVEVMGRGQVWSDILEKVGEYLRMGVDRVWVLDPATYHLHVFRANAEPVVLTEHDVVEDPEILPGFSYKVVEFFED